MDFCKAPVSYLYKSHDVDDYDDDGGGDDDDGNSIKFPIKLI